MLITPSNLYQHDGLDLSSSRSVLLPAILLDVTSYMMCCPMGCVADPNDVRSSYKIYCVTGYVVRAMPYTVEHHT